MAVRAGLLLAQGAQGAPDSYQMPASQLEVLGLRRWTVQMLRDSLARRVPGATLESDACQVLLRDSLHFADALVSNLIVEERPGAFRRYLTIKLVEPQDRARVRWAGAPPDSFTALRPAYAAVTLPLTDADGGFWRGRLERPLQFVGLDAAARAQALDAATARRRRPATRRAGTPSGTGPSSPPTGAPRTSRRRARPSRATATS